MGIIGRRIKSKSGTICDLNYSEKSNSPIKFSLAICIWLSGALFYLFQFVLRSSMGSMSDRIMQDLNISASMFAILSSSYYISYTLSQFPIGYLLDRFGHKKVFRISILSCLIGSILLTFSSSLFMFWLSRLVIGFGGSCAFIGCSTMSHALFSDRIKPLFIGSIGGMGKMGGILAAGPLVSLIGSAAFPTWRSVYVYMSLLGLLVGIMIWLFMINKSDIEMCRINKNINENNNGAEGDDKYSEQISEQVFDQSNFTSNVSPTKTVEAFKVLIKNKNIWLIALYAGLTYVPMSVFADAWAMLFIKNKLMVTSIEASYAVSMIFVGSFMGSSFIIPLLCNFLSKKTILLVTTFLSFIIFMILIYCDISYTVAIFLMCGIGILYGSHAFVWLYCSEFFPKLSASASGFVNGINMFFGMSLQPIVGMIMDKFGFNSNLVGGANTLSFNFGMSVVPICMFIGTIIVFLMPHVHNLKKH